MTPTRVIIDTDPGIDDALALILAFASPEVTVEAITTVAGNVTVEQAARNACAILDVIDPHPRPPVAVGAGHPLKKALRTAHDYHGEDGLGGIFRFRTREGTPRYPEPHHVRAPKNASELITEMIDSAPGEIVLICIGPLTNVAMAILAAPTKMERVKEIVVMGGAIAVPGNVTPGAEYNIYVDPHAAEVAFTSGLPITLVPLDVTGQVVLTQEQIEAVVRPIGSRVTQFICDSSERLFGYIRERRGCAAIPLHDPLAVGVVVDQSLVRREPLHVKVETADGPAQGVTIADRRQIRAEWKQPQILQVCMGVDADRFVGLFLERVCRQLS
jgi:inosine-uridine nucleoside N-ribohydrolase